MSCLTKIQKDAVSTTGSVFFSGRINVRLNHAAIAAARKNEKSGDIFAWLASANGTRSTSVNGAMLDFAAGTRTLIVSVLTGAFISGWSLPSRTQKERFASSSLVGGFGKRVVLVGVAADKRSICTTLFLAASLGLWLTIFAMDSPFVAVAILGGTLVTQFAERYSRKRSGNV